MVEGQISSVAMLIASQLEVACPGIFEVGIDFLLAKDRSLWFLEANSKPARYGFKVLAEDDQYSAELRRVHRLSREHRLLTL
jgi:hypothetical protein